MDESESLSHSKWECKYHLVFIPKCRRKVCRSNYGAILGRSFEPSRSRSSVVSWRDT